MVLTHQDFVLGELQLLHGHHVLSVNSSFQGSLVHQVLQLSSGETHRSSGDDLGLYGCTRGNDMTLKNERLTGVINPELLDHRTSITMLFLLILIVIDLIMTIYLGPL